MVAYRVHALGRRHCAANAQRARAYVRPSCQRVFEHHNPTVPLLVKTSRNQRQGFAEAGMVQNVTIHLVRAEEGGILRRPPADRCVRAFTLFSDFSVVTPLFARGLSSAGPMASLWQQ